MTGKANKMHFLLRFSSNNIEVLTVCWISFMVNVYRYCTELGEGDYGAKSAKVKRSITMKSEPAYCLSHHY